LFRFYTETENFDVSIEPKLTKDQPKQVDREHSLQFLQKIYGFFGFLGFFLGFFGFYLGFFGLFRNSLFRCFGCFASIPKQRVSMIRNKQKTHPNSLKENLFGYFSENLWLLRNSSVCFGCFYIGSKHRNFFFLVSRNKPKQTRNRACFGLFRFEPKIIFFCFEDTLILKFLDADPGSRMEKIQIRVKGIF
jgi:hypothetical protein